MQWNPGANLAVANDGRVRKMTCRALTFGLVVASLLVSAPGLTAHDKVTLRVTPAVSHAPAYVRITAQVEKDAANRMLEITADSPEFYRSSTIALEGEQAPRTTELTLKNLPRGQYTISATLVDNMGRKSLVQKSVLVIA